MSDNLLFHADLELSQSHVSKKNNRPIFRRGTRPFIGKSKKLQEAEAELIRKFIFLKDSAPIECPMHIKMHFIFNKKASFSRCDLSNLLELPQDTLQTAGIIKNDNLVHSLDGCRKLLGDSVRLKIWVYPHELSE